MIKVKEIELNKIKIGSNKMFVMAGPCSIESDHSITMKTAEKLKEMTTQLGISFVFKSSFDKANRTSLNSYRGIGIEEGLKLLNKVKKELEIPIVTDIHSTEQADLAAEVADIIQIPAFLCRQTDLLVAAAKTQKVINIKKGQFLAPLDIDNSAKKVTESGNVKVFVTERGVSFGYNNLVSDMRSIPIIQELGYPVVFDATHSVQLPGGAGTSSSGQRQFAETLAKSAIAAGCNGLFLEVHPNPDQAPCDGANMIDFKMTFQLLSVCNQIFQIVNK